MPTLTIISGLPGTGKTTLARQIECETGAVRLSADDLMTALLLNLWDSAAMVKIETLHRELLPSILADGHDVVVESGNWTRKERDELRSIARKQNARVYLRFLDEELEVLFTRIQSRGRESPAISMEDLIKWSSLIDRPDKEEWELFDSEEP